MRKEDIFIAKNYLTEKEIDMLNRLVTLFLDTAELRVQDEVPLNLEFWKSETDNVIAFSKKPLLQNAGTVSHSKMENDVSKTYLKFDSNRKKIEALEEDKLEKEAIEKLFSKVKKKKM